MTVTTDGLKAYLNIEHDEDDALLAGMIAAATDWIAGYTGSPVPAENTPPALDEATRQLAAHFYHVRGSAEDEGIPATVRTLCAPFMSWPF